MSVFTINVQDLPIELELTKSSGTIFITPAEQGRSTITYTKDDKPVFTANIKSIFICNPSESKDFFEIVFQYNSGSDSGSNIVYIQVPVKTGNVSPKFINPEFTEFIEDATGTSTTFRSNLSELINAIPDTKLYSNNDLTTNVIKTSMMYLNVTIPTTGLLKYDVPTDISLNSATTVKIKTIAPPLNFRKTSEYDSESKDPSRTKPITVYYHNNTEKPNSNNPDNLTHEIKVNLSTYTGLMIFSIVVGFIIATAYIIIIMIPDSKLHIIKPPRVNGGGRWSLQKTWNNISHQLSKILSR